MDFSKAPDVAPYGNLLVKMKIRMRIAWEITFIQLKEELLGWKDITSGFL